MLLLPDTPRWFYAKGRIAEGDKILSELHDKPMDDPVVAKMKKEIMHSLQMEETDDNKLTLKSLFWDRTPLQVGKRVSISFWILSIQQMMGERPLFRTRHHS